MVRIKSMSQLGESDVENVKYFRGFVNGVPVFSTREEAKIITGDSYENSIEFNLITLIRDFNENGSKIYIAESI